MNPSISRRFSPKRFAAAMSAGALLAGAGIAADASSVGATDANIVDVVLSVSGSDGFDRNQRDYDLLREALLATDLAGAVATSADITVFAPNDRAFIRLARDLGYEGRDEAGAFGFLAAATGFVSATEPGLLDDVLLYHVLPGEKSRRELNRFGAPLDTLLGVSLEVSHNRVIDGDPNDRNAFIGFPSDVAASNGVIHTVNRVLRPIDLEPAPPSETIVDIVLAVSGTSGFDFNSRDYDLLREALLATDLAGAVATSADITVFAPNDRAFIRLARDLGYEGRDEAGVFGFLAAATGFVSATEPGLLDDVLLYHVAPGAKTTAELRQAGSVATLLGIDLDIEHGRVVDADPDNRIANIIRPRDIPAANGTIQTVSQVLRPLDL